MRKEVCHQIFKINIFVIDFFFVFCNLTNNLERAQKHLERMNVEGECRWPKPVMVRVDEDDHSASKKYHPHCTLLHRCSNESGCCRINGQTCGPIKIEYVDLYVFVSKIV